MKKIVRLIIQYYLKVLTKVVLWRHKPLVIAVAGTTNKTFVKEMILEELGRGPAIRGNPKSFNTEIGLPLAVLFLPSGYSSIFKWVDVLLTGTYISFFSRSFPKVMVLELGVDRLGDMRYLLSMVQPMIGVVTTIDRSFPESGTSLDDIAEDMSVLVKTIPDSGVIILNADDERVEKLRTFAHGKVITYGMRSDVDACIEKIQTNGSGTTFQVQYQNQSWQMDTQRFGSHNLQAMAIAKIVAWEIKQVNSAS